MTRFREQHGFSLLEVTLVIGVLSLLLLGFYLPFDRLFGNRYSLNASSENGFLRQLEKDLQNGQGYLFCDKSLCVFALAQKIVYQWGAKSGGVERKETRFSLTNDDCMEQKLSRFLAHRTVTIKFDFVQMNCRKKVLPQEKKYCLPRNHVDRIKLELYIFEEGKICKVIHREISFPLSYQNSLVVGK